MGVRPRGTLETLLIAEIRAMRSDLADLYRPRTLARQVLDAAAKAGYDDIEQARRALNAIREAKPSWTTGAALQLIQSLMPKVSMITLQSIGSELP